MTQKTNRLASYKREEKQIIVAINPDYRTAFEGKTLGEIMVHLGITDDEALRFGYWQNAAGDQIATIFAKKGEVTYFFNVSQALEDMIDNSTFEGDLLDCQGRQYTINRPVTELVANADGRQERKPKMDEKTGKQATELVPSFNIGLPQGYRKVEDEASLFEGELSEEDAAKALAGSTK